ncbi:MAG: fibronectin type III domain-containing protein [Candidatus Poseidoniaceae archaeon]|nr:fibronectin type III domain-containing protein [Candidatus Poseidoniaceae archaeon]
MMKSSAIAQLTISNSKKSIFLVFLMLISSMSPMLIISPVSAHETANDVIWPKQGSNDTGWVQLDTVGANPTTGMQASTNWGLNFAPGAEISNLTMEIRVNGSDNLMIEEPIITAADIGINLFDWSGLGMLGSSDSFDGANPHSGRLSPNSEAGAVWTLPSGAEITELVVEALAPVDPAVSFEPVDIEIADSAVHFIDGRLYLAVTNSLLIIDYNNDPKIIDIIEFDGKIIDIEIDSANLTLHILTDDDFFHAISLVDSSELAPLPETVFDIDTIEFVQFEQFIIASDGTPYASNFDRVAVFDGIHWNNVLIKSDNGAALDIIEVNGILYFSFENEGVIRWDINANTALSAWTTANNLHSDSVTKFLVSGNQLLMASEDSGLARYDWSAGFWLSTWSSANWLTSDNIGDVLVSNNMLYILSGDSLHTYNTGNGIFQQTYSISDFGLNGDAGDDLISWPNIGPRSPSSDKILISDGFGLLAELTPGNTPLQTGNMLIASGPTSADMEAVVELNDVIYIAAGGFMNRYDTTQSRWLEPTFIGDSVNQLSTDGTYIYIAGEDSGAHKMHDNGTILQTWDTTTGLDEDEIQAIAMSSSGLITLSAESISIIDMNGVSPINSYEIDAFGLNGMAVYDEVAYVATDDSGLVRFDIANESFLTPWGSTGVNNANNVPIAVVGNILHLGLPGYGVVRKDLSTGEILMPLTESSGGNNPGGGGSSATEILPNDNIYALISDGSNLYIGTQQGAVKWDGSTAIDFQGDRSSWTTQPSQFFDFTLLGSDIYVGTNIGVCRYPTSTVAIDDCMNQYDGMPDWATYSVGTDGSLIYGGTTQGVGILTTNPFEVKDTWEAGEDTDNAPVEVIGDIAYVGLNGIGIARYDIPNNTWLSTWTENNILDDGNEDVTGLVADIRPNHLWVGGDDGFQLIDVINETETYDIEKSNSIYLGNGDPYQMTIHNDIMYYHQGSSSNSVYRIDVANFTGLSNIDAGIQLNDNSGDAWGMGIVGDTLFVSVASNSGWPDYYDGKGGIAQWDILNDNWSTDILPAGQVDRVTAYQASNGEMWISWGENKLELYAQNNILIGSWDSTDGLEFPIREIIEFDGKVLFATEDGVARFDPANGNWTSTWEEGNGLPNNAGSEIYELWTNGVDLVVGGGDGSSGWGGFQGGAISHWNGTSWNVFQSQGQGGILNGYPITMSECGGVLNVGIYDSNGGIEQLDLATSTITGTFTRATLGEGRVSGVACDTSTDTMYVAFYSDEEPIKKYSFTSGQWLPDITTQTHNLPSDRIWWDAIDYAAGKLVLGHGLGQQGSNVIGGGYSVITTSGASTSQVNFNGRGSSVTSFQWLGTEWLIGQAGGSSGYSHVDTLGPNGQTTMYNLPGLVSGQVTTMTGNNTHLWITTIGENVGFGQSTGAGILQGEKTSTGGIEWQFGWTLPANSRAKDTQLIGTDLYISTYPSGLMKLDTLTGILTQMSGALHNNMDGLKLVGTDLVVGLQGNFGSSAGVQVFDTTTGTFGNGRLLAGLPSNYINGFAANSDVMYIATNGGVGRWSYLTSDWLNPLTTTDGLPTNIIEDLELVNNDLWMATPSGLVKMDTTSNSVSTITNQNGLLGTSTWGLTSTMSTVVSPNGTASTLETIHVSHDGAGNERPGVSSVDATTGLVSQTHRFDQLPSNTVTAIASDWWGLHIATDVGPMTHWNGLNSQFEDGVASWQIPSWPIEQMVSNGDEVLVIGNNIITIIEARTSSHSSIKTLILPEEVVSGGTITADNVWITTETSGLFGWVNSAQWTEVERFELRRADPLNMGFNLVNRDITDMTHPGMTIELANLSNTIALGDDVGSPGVHGILFQGVPLAFSSPVSGSATWAKSNSLKYNVTLNLSQDQSIQQNLQLAINNAMQINGTKYVQLNLRSLTNGSLQVRLTYDYIKLETPIDMVDLIDRPDDGGETLTASWSLVHDDDFSRYLIYLNEGPFLSTPLVDDFDLSARQVDKTISLHSRLQSEVNTANGQLLQNGVDYYALVVVEYNDGRLGTPSLPIGPASPSDEIPQPPQWAQAGPHEGGNDGDLDLEWKRCTALDLLNTNIYTSTIGINDVLGLTPEESLPPSEGNSTILNLNPGRPYWIGLTCVDEAGQEDLLNATIIGPVVPTGGLNDLTAPPKLENVDAIDTPNDDGGRVTVTWDVSTADDCTFYAVWIRENTPSIAVVGLALDEAGFSQAQIIDDCSTNSTIVDGYDGISLQDGQSYLVAVVAYDDWLNVDLIDVDIVEVTPFRNTVGTGNIPDRIGTITAFDHPDDDGTAIDVIWTISDADDFAYYIVWVADQPVTDLSGAWAAFGDDPAKCGCLKIDKQWIDEDKNPIQLTISTALYGESGNLMDITQTTPQLIKPDIELYVTVTVHDIKGNVHLTNLIQATTTPINNLQDTTPPERLSNIQLTDRPMDDGTALLLDFELSDVSDVATYEVYAATWAFQSVMAGGDGPTTPIATLSRVPNLPLEIVLVAGDQPVVTGQEIWVAIVVRDSAGNAWEDNLNVVSNQSIDDGFDAGGDYLTPVEDVTVEWKDETDILVSWEHSNDGDVRGYQIYISTEDFSSTDDATMVGEVQASNSFMITNEYFEDLDNETSWYVAISPFDEVTNRNMVEAVMLDPFTKSEIVKDEDGEDSSEFASLLTPPNLVAAGLVLLAVFLLIAIVRTRGNQRSRNKSWELQEATWGIQDNLGSWDDVDPIVSQVPQTPPPSVSQAQTNDIYGAAQRLESNPYERQMYQSQQPVLQPQNQNLLNDLNGGQTNTPVKPKIDTSFLDDLL